MKSSNDSMKKQVSYRLIAALVALAIISFKATSLLTFHIHVLPDGRVIAHSHPLPGSNDHEERHKHTSWEYIFLDAVGHSYQADDLAVVNNHITIKQVCTRFEDGQINPVTCIFFYSQIKRAPPFVSFS